MVQSENTWTQKETRQTLHQVIQKGKKKKGVWKGMKEEKQKFDIINNNKLGGKKGNLNLWGREKRRNYGIHTLHQSMWYGCAYVRVCVSWNLDMPFMYTKTNNPITTPLRHSKVEQTDNVKGFFFCLSIFINFFFICNFSLLLLFFLLLWHTQKNYVFTYGNAKKRLESMEGVYRRIW